MKIIILCCFVFYLFFCTLLKNTKECRVQDQEAAEEKNLQDVSLREKEHLKHPKLEQLTEEKELFTKVLEVENIISQTVASNIFPEGRSQVEEGERSQEGERKNLVPDQDQREEERTPHPGESQGQNQHNAEIRLERKDAISML